MSNISCPYCDEYQEINHDDGQGFSEGELHEQCCDDCDKVFTFSTSIIYYHEAFQADCLNDGSHKFKPTHTHPKFLTRMQCSDCEAERQLTEIEWLDLMGPMEIISGWYK